MDFIYAKGRGGPAAIEAHIAGIAGGPGSGVVTLGGDHFAQPCRSCAPHAARHRAPYSVIQFDAQFRPGGPITIPDSDRTTATLHASRTGARGPHTNTHSILPTPPWVIRAVRCRWASLQEWPKMAHMIQQLISARTCLTNRGPDWVAFDARQIVDGRRSTSPSTSTRWTRPCPRHRHAGLGRAGRVGRRRRCCATCRDPHGRRRRCRGLATL